MHLLQIEYIVCKNDTQSDGFFFLNYYVFFLHIFMYRVIYDDIMHGGPKRGQNYGTETMKKKIIIITADGIFE